MLDNINKELLLNAFKAWCAGLACAGLFLLPVSTLLRATDSSTLELIQNYFLLAVNGLLASFTIGIFLTAPIFLVALILLFIFKRILAKYPVAFIVFGVSILCFIQIALMASRINNNWGRENDFWIRFFHIATTAEGMLYILPMVTAGIVFYISMIDSPNLFRKTLS